MNVDTFTDINVIKSFTTVILFANKKYKHEKEFFGSKLVFSKKVSKDIKSNGSFEQKNKNNFNYSSHSLQTFCKLQLFKLNCYTCTKLSKMQ